MSEREESIEQQPTPSVHTLRVAVFDLYSRNLISRDFSAPTLFENNEPLGKRGQHLAPIEYRATAIGRSIKQDEGLPVEILPTLEPLGFLGSLSDNPTGYAVATSRPVNLRNFATGLRGYDLQEVHAMASQEVRKPDSTIIGTQDAQFLVNAFKRIHRLHRFKAA